VMQGGAGDFRLIFLHAEACPGAAEALSSDKAAATPRPFTSIPKTGIITWRSVNTSPQPGTGIPSNKISALQRLPPIFWIAFC
jgi:hypothetical protein